jgi:Uma2 family endonuclease
VLQPAEVAPQEIRPLKRAEYERLVALGAFEDDRVELIRGNLVTMAPNDPEHASPIEILTDFLVRAVGERGRVRIQLPLVAADESEPEPDLAVVPVGNYAKQHPASAFLVIEVAVTSLKKDREVKAPLYAASGVAEYWIIDVRGRRAEVFRDPSGGVYRRVSLHERSELLSPEAFPDISVPLTILFE